MVYDKAVWKLSISFLNTGVALVKYDTMPSFFAINIFFADFIRKIAAPQHHAGIEGDRGKYDVQYIGRFHVSSQLVFHEYFLIVSDMRLSFAKQTWVVVFDKVQAESYQITDLYDRVYNGEWTLDYILEIADTVYTDLNGDGTKDVSDYYAFTSCTANGCLMAAYLYGSGVSFAQIHGDKAVMTLNNEKSV